MDNPSSEIKALYEKALHYDREGDIYNAIKLYKKVAKSSPHWAPPFERLGALYKNRQDWKAALHYIKKSVALNPLNKSAWWDLGIAATALKRWRIARNVWSKFGLQTLNETENQVSSIRLQVNNQFEVVAAKILDPARAMIISIPFPGSMYRFKDIVLYDRNARARYVVENRSIPVFDELGIFKHSVYQTASCMLQQATIEDIQKLEQICERYGVGMEVWSNAQWNMGQSTANQTEYYHHKNLNKKNPESSWIAIAAKDPVLITSILESWEIICLKSFENLHWHN